MFEISDRLIGIYKTYNITKSVAVNPKEIASKGLCWTLIYEDSSSLIYLDLVFLGFICKWLSCIK